MNFPPRLSPFAGSVSGTIFLRLGLRVASMAAMKLALEHVRRMRGGAQAQMMRCDDEAYYIVKFQNNPQHLRILANEMLATRLAARLGLCVPQAEVVEVRPEIIAGTPDLVIQLGLGRKPCAAGKQFGSQFPGHPARMAVHDFLPEEQLLRVRNLADFLGVLAFDKWTCNTNGRQAIFSGSPPDDANASARIELPGRDAVGGPRRGEPTNAADSRFNGSSCSGFSTGVLRRGTPQ